MMSGPWQEHTGETHTGDNESQVLRLEKRQEAADYTWGRMLTLL